MKEVITMIRSWCDYPGCAQAARTEGRDTQDTASVEFWVYISGKGRKTSPITVELCEEHREHLKSVFQTMQKYDQRGD